MATKEIRLELQEELRPNTYPIWLTTSLQREVFHKDKISTDLVIEFLSLMMNKLRRREYMTIDEIQYHATRFLENSGITPIDTPSESNLNAFIITHSVTLHYVASVLINYITASHYLVGYQYIGNHISLLFDEVP